MIWQLLLKGNESSSYSYLNVASQVLNGKAESDAIVQGNNFDWAPYTGGASNCETQ
jgi:chitinase